MGRCGGYFWVLLAALSILSYGVENVNGPRISWGWLSMDRLGLKVFGDVISLC